MVTAGRSLYTSCPQSEEAVLPLIIEFGWMSVPEYLADNEVVRSGAHLFVNSAYAERSERLYVASQYS